MTGHVVLYSGLGTGRLPPIGKAPEIVAGRPCGTAGAEMRLLAERPLRTAMTNGREHHKILEVQ